MRKNRIEPPDAAQARPPAPPETEYAPKAHTLRDQIVFGIKLGVIGGILFLLLWVFEKM